MLLEFWTALTGNSATSKVKGDAATGAIYVEQLATSNRGLPVNLFLTAAGNGTGTNNLNGSYATPTDFYYQVTTGSFYVYSLLIVIADATSFNLLDYGAIASGLTNGVKFFLTPSGQSEIQILAGVTIKTNADILTVIHDVVLTSFAGTSQAIAAESDLKKVFGIPLFLNTGDRITVRLNDDFTGLIKHTFALGGERFST